MIQNHVRIELPPIVSTLNPQVNEPLLAPQIQLSTQQQQRVVTLRQRVCSCSTSKKIIALFLLLVTAVVLVTLAGTPCYQWNVQMSAAEEGMNHARAEVKALSNRGDVLLDQEQEARNNAGQICRRARVCRIEKCKEYDELQKACQQANLASWDAKVASEQNEYQSWEASLHVDEMTEKYNAVANSKPDFC